MDYDSSWSALYHPERDDPVADFSTNWRTAPICAELSRLAYYRFERNNDPRLGEALTKAGFAAPEPFNDPATDTQAFGTVAPDGTIYVAFRGSQPDSPIDFLTDANFKLVPWSGVGHVHNGFRDAFHSIQDRIDRWLRTAGNGRLVVTGHSLGAALATLMAAAYPRAALATFGSPVVGDQAFADQFAQRRVGRYVDCTDLVTLIPGELVGYAHLQGLRYIDRFGTVRSAAPGDAELAEDRSIASREYFEAYHLLPFSHVPARNLADHAPVNYISAVLGRRRAA